MWKMPTPCSVLAKQQLHKSDCGWNDQNAYHTRVHASRLSHQAVCVDDSMQLNKQRAFTKTVASLYLPICMQKCHRHKKTLPLSQCISRSLELCSHHPCSGLFACLKILLTCKTLRHPPTKHVLFAFINPSYIAELKMSISVKSVAAKPLTSK